MSDVEDEGRCWCDDCNGETLFVKARCCGMNICVDCGSDNVKTEFEGYVPLERGGG